MAPQKTVAVETTAQAYLELLGAMGIKYFLANGGDSIVSIVDAFARRATEKKPFPRPMQLAHECCAVGMGYGYYLATGIPPLVMVHHIPGTANALAGLLNATHANIPLVLTSGRSAITESGRPGCRDISVQWGQEAYDQGGIVRQFVKWDYELKCFDQLESVVRRAFAIAMSEPRGPVYLALPRDLLAEPHAEFTFSEGGWDPNVTRPAAETAAIEKLAAMVAESSNPLIITRTLGRNPSAVSSLVQLAESFALPVVECFYPNYLSFPSSHPLHLGYEPGELVASADLVLVIDCEAPWLPVRDRVNPEAKVVHIGVDPLQTQYPVWGFRGDLAIAADSALAVPMLTEALAPIRKRRASAIEERLSRLSAVHRKQREAWKQEVEQEGKQEAITFGWLSHCLGQLKDENTIFLNEYDLDTRHAALDKPGSFFGLSAAGSLGWATGAALGIKLGAPEKSVIALIGDGAYLFGVPSACHLASAAHNLPVLTVVANNGGWGAVNWCTRMVHPEGWAARSNNFEISRFNVDPAYEKIAEAFGGRGFTVSNPRELPEALKRALRVVRDEGRQALLNVKCAKV